MKSMIEQWQKYRRLSTTERRVLRTAFWLLPLMTGCLRCLGFRRTQKLLLNLPLKIFTPPPSAPSLPFLQRIGRLVRIAGHHNIFPATCLTQSLTLWWLLRQMKISTDLRIGVIKSGHPFSAHAWVEFEGVALNDLPAHLQEYLPFNHSFASDGLTSKAPEAGG